ncbi:uncharacterized protein G2W53_038797 [Senna tora]|uniref:Uncharacterized protein n=1 Tax=Senna tora TaxID=362788 RepID=A0A834SNY5_9FABA|nr:uncharacterized protein G2W53_038797 [Senna tora]
MSPDSVPYSITPELTHETHSAVPFSLCHAWSMLYNTRCGGRAGQRARSSWMINDNGTKL